MKEYVFGEELVTYFTNYIEGFRLQEDKDKAIYIGKVKDFEILTQYYWLPHLSKVIRSVLSIFHGTANVDGVINVIRHTVGKKSQIDLWSWRVLWKLEHKRLVAMTMTSALKISRSKWNLHLINLFGIIGIIDRTKIRRSVLR